MKALEAKYGDHDWYYQGDFRDVEDNFFWYVGRSRIIQKVLGEIKPQLGWHASVVELGCGGGGMLTVLQREFKSAIGYDNCEAALDLCRARGIESAYLNDLKEIPQSAGTVDLVCSFDVLEHFKDDAALLAECFRVLRPGGLLLGTVPALQSLWSPHDRLAGHYRRYNKKSLNQTLTKCGFQVLDISYFMFLLSPLLWVDRILARMGWGRGENIFSVPRIVNVILRSILRIEAVLFRRIPFPWGTSLIFVAQKTA